MTKNWNNILIKLRTDFFCTFDLNIGYNWVAITIYFFIDYFLYNTFSTIYYFITKCKIF